MWKQLLMDLIPLGVQRFFWWSLPHEEANSRDFISTQTVGQFAHRQARILIDPEDSLTYNFSIPKCASNELNRAIKLEGERILPLHISKVMTAYRVAVDESMPERYTVDLIAVKKKLIDAVLDKADQLNISLMSIEVSTDLEGHFVEVPISSIVNKRRMVRWVAVFLIFASLLVSIQIPSLYVDRLETAIDETAEQIRSARSATRQIATLQSQMNERRNLSSAIVAVGRQQRVTLLIEQLTDASPDHVVLETLAIETDKLRLTGVAQNPEEWALALEEVPSFSFHLEE